MVAGLIGRPGTPRGSQLAPSMLDPQMAAFPALAAMGAAKMPPLVHPQALAAAAAHCAEFGGDREALDAAALAGALIQTRMLGLRKERAGGLGLLPLPHGSGLAGAAAPAPAPPALAAQEPSPELSEQALKAMAAARATNVEKMKAKEPDDKSDDPFKQQQQQYAQVDYAQAMQMLPPGLAQGLYMPSMPSMPVLPPGLMPTMPPGLRAPMATGAAPPMPQALPQGLAPGLMPQPGRDAAADARLQPAAMPPSGQREPQQAARPPKPPGQQDRKEEKREEPRAEPQKLQPPKPVEDLLRCHLHRKPQLNCKICRRIAGTGRGGQPMPYLQARPATGNPEESASARRRGAEPFEIANKQTFNLNPMLRDQILKNTYFKTLVTIETFEGIVEQMYQYSETAEAYGGGQTTVPSTLFCCLFRLFTIGISYEDNILCYNMV